MSPVRISFFLICIGLFPGPALLAFAATAQQAAGAAFIGSAACKDCHEHEYDNFVKFSKKAHARQSVEKMSSKLTPEELADCYSCHSTGYGQKGGFVDYEKTPQLGDVGCETCHGPGAEHAQSGDTATITRKPSIESCLVCHNAKRIQNFNFRPLRYSGAH